MNFLPIYSTPIWQGEYQDIEEYQELFLIASKQCKEQVPSVKKSNIFGYQSPSGIFNQEERFFPLLDYICQIAHRACSDLDFDNYDIAITSSTLNVNDSRQCINAESVGTDVFTAIFYLKSPEGSGNLVIKNPGINGMWKGLDLATQKNQFTAESIKIEPVEGNVILFPSYVPYSIEPNDHDEELIFITCNIIALPKGSIPQKNQENEENI